MFSLSLIIWILFVHWFSDFVCHTDKQAINKSHDWLSLFQHSITYFFILVGGCMLYESIVGFSFTQQTRLLIMLNLPSHFIIDAITSRINAKLYVNYRHWFFTNIGFDQFLHLAFLFWTLS